MGIENLFLKKGHKRGTIGKAIVSLLFIAVGVFLIYYAFTRPCNVAPITQIINGQTSTITNPAEMNRLICLSSDYVAMVCTLIGMAMIFPGVGGLFRSLTEGKKEESKPFRKKSKK